MDNISVGRIVHYAGLPSELPCRAAIVQEVVDFDLQMVDLCVFLLDGPEVIRSVKHAEPHDGLRPFAGSWHWPERY